MIERELWHPVATVDSVADRPSAVQLLQQDLVLWRDGIGHVHAWIDQCPHRGSRLSMGRVVGAVLECPYHGWQFDANAQLINVPALPEFTPPAAHRVRAFDVCEQYGLIWVRLQAAADRASVDVTVDPTSLAAQRAEPPLFAAESELRLRKVSVGPYDVATSAPRIVENFLDLAHFGFVHEHWLGARAEPAIADYQIESTASGFVARGCRAWQPQSSIHAQSGAMVEYTYEVNAPFTAILTKIPDQGSVAISEFRESIALFVCPVEPEQSRIWFRLAMNDFVSPDSELASFQDTIFNQDKPILESQRPKCLPLDPGAELHSAADKSSAAYRRLLRQWGIRFGVTNHD